MPATLADHRRLARKSAAANEGFRVAVEDVRRGRRAAAPAGLVHAAYLNAANVRAFPAGSVLEFKARAGLPPPKGGPRGTVKDFSRGSRWRLRKLLSTLRRDALPSFVTLTYPGAWSDDDRRWKADIHALLVAMRRDFPGLSAVWKL